MKLGNKENWEFPILIPKNPVKKNIKNLFGKIVQIFHPQIRKDILDGKTPITKIERAVLCAIFIELKATKQHEKLAELHKKIWSSNETQGYYDLTSKRLLGMFNLLKENLYSTISDLSGEFNFQEFLELGCGDGIVVNNLSEGFKDIPNFVGMDINSAQIEVNKITYNSNKRLRFFSGDISKNINLIKGPNKFLLSFGGVLEYLTENEIEFLFAELSKLENIAFIIYEPIESGFNIKEEKHSILYGSEFSFCHPYHYYFTKNGFKIIQEKQIESETINFIYLAAHKR